MRYCKKCVQPDTRPGIKFDEHGVCPACRFAEQAGSIDWEATVPGIGNDHQIRENRTFPDMIASWASAAARIARARQ